MSEWDRFSNLMSGLSDFSPLLYSIRQASLRAQEILQPITEISETIKLRFAEIAESTRETARPFSTIRKLSDVQYVYWEYLTDDFIDTILESTNTNKTLRELCIKNKWRITNQTIQSCEESELLFPYRKLFSQTRTAYNNKQYELAVIGLLPVIDGLLSDVSGNTTTNIFTRADFILQKAENDESISSDEISVIALAWTFRETMQSLSANINFSQKEPKNLNRHWIMHGRSRRKKTRLDCVKLFNFIYAIISICKLNQEEINVEG